MEQKVKEVLEKVKVTASIAAGAAGKAAEAAGRKAGEVVEITKLNLQIFDLNTEIEVLYKEIGKLVYNTHIGEEVLAEELDEKLALLDEKRAMIASIKEKVAERKTVNKCPNCGKDCDKDDSFCRTCGAQL
ncbi:MAG: zinc ribbon domain-containing protein [Clostridiales bacterium]|nr:zinc ribbon domain-containing protein [Clostridiales bacterium]